MFHVSDPPNRLQVRHIPVPLTCGVFDGAVITDPSLLEEDLLTTQITVTSTADGQVREIQQVHRDDLFDAFPGRNPDATSKLSRTSTRACVHICSLWNRATLA